MKKGSLVETTQGIRRGKTRTPLEGKDQPAALLTAEQKRQVKTPRAVRAEGKRKGYKDEKEVCDLISAREEEFDGLLSRGIKRKGKGEESREGKNAVKRSEKQA